MLLSEITCTLDFPIFMFVDYLLKKVGLSPLVLGDYLFLLGAL